MTITRTLSPQQEVVRNFPRTHTGSAFAEAVAGAGKTTTAMYMIAETTGTVGVMAYNKSAALEFDHKARELGFSFGNRVRFGTCHSFGFGAWRFVHKQVKAGPEAAREKTDMMYKVLGVPRVLESFTSRLVSLAKQRAIGLYGSIDDQKLYYDIIEHFDLDHEIEDEGLIKAGVEYAIAGLKFHKEIGPEIIDFDDMIWLPVVTGVRMFGNNWIVGDEWQDANPARRALARKMLKPNGRALFIGDRHQAIYGFTGADNDSIDQTIRDFNCIELPMTVTFRCPRAVVERAQTVVKHIEAHESAPEGSVITVETAEFDKIETLNHQGLLRPFDQVNDAILCRNTKPLVATAFQLIKRGVPCHVEGRDIGAGLIKLIERFSSAKSLPNLRDRMVAYKEQQMQKLIAKGKETQAQSIEDKVDTILVIADSCAAFTVEALKSRIVDMFQDSEGERRPTLTLSTVHKSKGREWQRVFLMGENLYMPSSYARQEWQLEQERNLQYVAYTRAKSELVLVDMERT